MSLRKRKKKKGERQILAVGEETPAKFSIFRLGWQRGDVWAQLCMTALKTQFSNLPSDSVLVREASGSDLASYVELPIGRRMWWSCRFWVVSSFSSCYDFCSATEKSKKKGGAFWWYFGFASKLTFREKAKRATGQQ